MLPHITMRVKTDLLAFVLALADLFKHRKSGLFGVGNGHRLEFGWRIEAGNDFAHPLFAGWTICERSGRQRPAQREPSATDLAVAFAQLVFVKRHETNFDCGLPIVEWKIRRGDSI